MSPRVDISQWRCYACGKQGHTKRSCKRNRVKSDYLIYALVDPRDNKIRYVGKSTRGLSHPYDYLQLAKDLAVHRTRTLKWVKELLDAGLEYKVKVLEEVATKNALAEKEKYWIIKLMSNSSLTNTMFSVAYYKLREELDQLYLKKFGTIVRY